MKIYTRQGDKGQTGLYGGARVSKSDLTIQVLGEIDELNSTLGLAACVTTRAWISSTLTELQSALFELGSEVASGGKLSALEVFHALTERLEQEIDAGWEELPKLTQFVLPGGSEAASRLHFSRCVCRRTERGLVEWGGSEAGLEFLNRLSDWLFCAARAENLASGTEDVTWKKKC